ncbi:MAG: hypothetical protein ACREPX_03190, partial [Rhodanobacteraceae bacterium]
MLASNALNRLRRLWPAALVLAGIVACAIGFFVHRADLVLLRERLRETLILAGLSIIAALLLRFVFRVSLAGALAFLWFAALGFFCGVLPVAATLAIAATALAVGTLLVSEETPARAVLALCVGLALIAGVDGWLVLLPGHRWYVVLPLLIGVCAWRRRVLSAVVTNAWQRSLQAIAEEPLTAAFAIVLIGIASTGAWLPTSQSDDLAYHLGLPTQLQLAGVYAPDPHHQIWQLAPWLGDVLQGLAQVLAGREARGAVDMLWLLLGAAGTWNVIAALGGDVRVRWLGVAAFASLPLLAALAGGMLTELPATALVLALALAILVARKHDVVHAAAVLVGGLVALKLSHAVAAIVLCAWAALRVRGRMPWKRLPIAFALFFLVAGSSYVFAAWISGNPFLPLFNDVFQSDVLAPRQLADRRWHAGFHFDLPWSITFQTARYLEAWNGGFGFVLVLLLGAWALALIRPAHRGIAAAATLITLLPLVPMQYARYAFPGVALLLPILLITTRDAIGARGVLAVAIALCALDLAFQANAGWSLESVARSRLVRNGGNVDEVFSRFAPERLLIRRVREESEDDSIVLALDPRTPWIAELGPRGRSVAWYDPALEKERISADSERSGERWVQLFR